jgi:hypothetical protein
MLSFFKRDGDRPLTYAEQVDLPPRLLSGKFCGHAKFGNETSQNVSDETGTYVRIQGACRERTCKGQQVFKIFPALNPNA